MLSDTKKDIFLWDEVARKQLPIRRSGGIFAACAGEKIPPDSLAPLSGAALRNLRSSLAIEWTYHSNGIEGNTLTLQETKMVVEEGLTIRLSACHHFEK